MSDYTPKREEEILRFWKDKRIFEKSLKKTKGKKIFSFYDGPPFATGQPHYGHILATTIKDAVLRYRTMRGYHVPRRVGWDCHGLPVENLIEKELGIKNKKEIEEYGVEKFNDACRASVFRCVGDFQEMLKRVGRWADYDKSYATLDTKYIESVWWVLKQLDKQGLVYRDYRVSPYCPRCGTPLSNFEVNQGYQEKEDPSIIIKFPVADREKTFLLAWTTTPWTLPGNVALGVHPEEEYAEASRGDETFIFAANLQESLGDDLKITKRFKGSDLVGLRYEPLFDAIALSDAEHKENAFQVLPAEFVSMDEGTGIVHTAVMYGEDDFALGKKHGLPMRHTVNLEGRFTDEVILWKGMDAREANPKIIGNLRSRGLLFREESASHSYPHCWRCDTPLLYYALTSWYIAVSSLRASLTANNKKTSWMPPHIKERRFGEWLKDARDWAFSRSRYWGSPLPIWECESCGERKTLGSVRELLNRSFSPSKFFVLRHGHSERQELDIASSWPEKKPLKLTERGKAQAKKSARELASKGVDVIYASDLLRTKETAEIVAKELGVPVRFDKCLREYGVGVLNGKSIDEVAAFWHMENETKEEHHLRRFTQAPPKGESYVDMQRRLIKGMRAIERKERGKKVLLVSHELPLSLLEGMMRGITDRVKLVRFRKSKRIKTGEWREIPFKVLPLNRNMELDLHRPYIDEVVFPCSSCGSEMKRVGEVFDCWFESGSMPYAQWHYPFENKKMVEETFPADFIAEGLDQTRGWFYTLHVLAAALTRKNIGLGKNKPAFKNVIVNGLVLGADGKKLSKRLKNYPDVGLVFNLYGADALRHFLLSSTPIGEDYRLSEDRVRDSWRKVVSGMQNSTEFFLLYRGEKGKRSSRTPKPVTLLDAWILSRLAGVSHAMRELMDAYDLTRASRLIGEFLEDLSNWYIRRSRGRFRQPGSPREQEEAGAVMEFVLKEFSKLSAPFMPFVSEDMFQKLRGALDEESVHLASFPVLPARFRNKKLEEQMALLRDGIAKALQIRAREGIKVRQPLISVSFPSSFALIAPELLDLAKEELNVREVKISKSEEDVALDTVVTPDLQAEGNLREILRHIQEMRREAGYLPRHRVALYLEGSEELMHLLSHREKEIQERAGIEKVSFSLLPNHAFDVEREVRIEGNLLRLRIKRT